MLPSLSTTSDVSIKVLKASPAKAKDDIAFRGFSALAIPHPIVPKIEPTLAPLSTFNKLEPPPTACIPSLEPNSIPAPSKAVGFAVAISAADPHLATPFTPFCFNPKYKADEPIAAACSNGLCPNVLLSIGLTKP